ncbi:transposase IS4 family protein (plasmid) [Paraburkholderia phymatum STM815]|uniref:Transposase IS4 family protein n=1 Tax=Paraburkholderia phymatum (strain DSM 17167 / CIP 108236 / LMG 21445 / STM815) TaxID=391038 RepID=B2JTE9_PARP8|nr:transposase IS4 family protein [Paraburkholderia phymatum STM815]
MVSPLPLAMVLPVNNDSGDMHSIIRARRTAVTSPAAVILDGRTLRSTSESRPHTGCDGYKGKQGSNVHLAIESLGQLLAVSVRPANERQRAQVGELARQVPLATGQTVKVAFSEQGYTGEEPAQPALDEGIQLQTISSAKAKKGLVLSPRRWVVERCVGWLNRFRLLARYYERLSKTLAGLHFVVVSVLMQIHFVTVRIGPDALQDQAGSRLRDYSECARVRRGLMREAAFLSFCIGTSGASSRICLSNGKQGLPRPRFPERFSWHTNLKTRKG